MYTLFVAIQSLYQEFLFVDKDENIQKRLNKQAIVHKSLYPLGHMCKKVGSVVVNNI